MTAKVKGYGKRGKENIAIEFEKLQISSAKGSRPLAVIRDNQQKQLELPKSQSEPPKSESESPKSQSKPPKSTRRPLKPKKKTVKNTRHRKSLVPEADVTVDSVEIDEPTKLYLDPLLRSSEVGSFVRAFNDWARVWTTHCKFVKVAQGSYGGVFRIESKARPHTFTIGKLIPLRARVGPGSRTAEYTTVKAASNEVTFLSSLDELPGFVQFRKAEVLQGRLPTALEEASEEFDARQDEGEISRQWVTACGNSAQLWLFFEMSDAGTDLEAVLTKDPTQNFLQNSKGDRTRFLTVPFIRDIFWQVASSLALGEQRYELEHRDLHLGNICLKTDNPLGGQGSETTGVTVTIIDYTLSRARFPFGSDPGKGPGEVTLFEDLSNDPALFQGSGADQYDVYREMKKHSSNDWSSYQPFSNVLWLAYLLRQIMAKRLEQRLTQEYHELWNDLNALLRMFSDHDSGEAFHSAQDVVRYCESNGLSLNT
ncbi:MAG: hypothetical protein Q9219_004740 [cf. Caloplaca sp. 3 TL-2023]